MTIYRQSVSEDSQRDMAKAKVSAAGIEYIQGAMKRPKVINGHNHGNYLVMTHRTAETNNPNCQRIYTFDADRYKRTSAPSADEMAIRDKFTAVSRAVALRKKDLSKMAADQAAFEAQKATGKKTLRAYLWMLESDAYDQAQG